MRFGEACTGWNEGRLTQEEAAWLLGVCERTFRRNATKADNSCAIEPDNSKNS
jgi:predicted DNA-binding protein (UPF0251 family)